MTVLGHANATPTDPKGQFSNRQARGVGVSHRPVSGRAGDVALFANTGSEIHNFREFVTHYLDFHEDDDISVTTRWTLSSFTGVGTLTRTDDTPQGLAVLATGAATNSHGVQIQETDSNAQGEMYNPLVTQSHIVAWESRGSMNLTLEADWFIGIAETDATFMSAAGVLSGDNYIGFHHVQDATTVSLVQCGTANANKVTVAASVPLWTPADASTTKRSLGVRIEANNSMRWYVDDVEVGRTEVGLAETGGTVVAFDDAMCSTFSLFNNSAASAQATMTIDYIAGQVSRVA